MKISNYIYTLEKLLFVLNITSDFISDFNDTDIF